MGGFPFEDDEKAVLVLAPIILLILLQLGVLLEQFPHTLYLLGSPVHHRLWLGIPSMIAGFWLWLRLPEKKDWVGMLVMVFAVAVLLKP